ncbi:tRNA pseudouridine(38/39) synthase-like [Diadema antillarum]|uniref:tRNA pseudouridine(38/39) synthase-like n=1 Tax=Diadema antillarum TaxID=105358 RepID=UPI003A8B482F
MSVMMDHRNQTVQEIKNILKRQLTDREWSKVNKILDQHRSANVRTESKESDAEAKKGRKSRVSRPFDFSRYNTRHVALRISYLGWDFHGYVVQEDSENTVEHHLFEALTKTKLVESRSTSNYSRCGRTDVGVSAFGQVIAIDLRTNLLEGQGVIQRAGGTARQRNGTKTEEINYPQVLNRVLPSEIRVLAWAPVEPGFHARFDTLSRTYKYFFPAGDFDIEVMQEASQKLVGTHDFRNFCKMDVANGVVNHVRTVTAATVEELDGISGAYQMFEFTITGMAFLYHQVRCVMAILFLIGQHKEKPEIIDQLLDVERQPCKPQYSMATDFPLVLYECAYSGIQWIYDTAHHERTISQFQEKWTGHIVRATMIKRMLDGLTSVPVITSTHPCTEEENKVDGQSSADNIGDFTAPESDARPTTVRQVTCLSGCLPSKHHRPLLDRPRAESLQNRIEHFAKRRKLDHSIHEESTQCNLEINKVD